IVAVIAAVGDLALARLLIHRGVGGAVLPALLPALLVVVAVLVESTRVALFYAALALSIVLPVVTAPITIAGSALYAADLRALLALVSWVGARLLGRPVQGSRALALTGIGFPLFVLAVGQGVVRGHFSYGLSIVSEPMRLLLYASIALTITQVDTRRLYRGVVAVFYVGTVWMLLNAAYYVATGKSQTDHIDVSTGGHRAGSLTVGADLGSALLLALLNIRLSGTARERTVHLAVAALALVGIVLSLGRRTFVAVAIVVPLLLILSPRLMNRFLSLL